jgi:hypothetical protein
MKLYKTSAYMYLVGILVIFIGYLPTFRVPVMGDDFYLQFQATGETGGDFWLWQAINFNGAISSGHFKPLGNFLDSIPQFLVYPVSASLGVSTRYFYFAQGFLLLILIVLAATWFSKIAIRLFAQVEVFKPRIFLAIALVSAISIQIHPWSNDPVTTYLATGMVSAAISFSILGLTLRAIENSSEGWSNRHAWFSAFVGVCGVLQYEMNLAAIAGSGFLILFYYWTSSIRKLMLNKRLWVSIFTSVIIPGGVFLLGRYISALIAPDSGGYTGTQFSLSEIGFVTLSFALISTLPAGAWFTSFQGLPAMAIHWELIGLLFASALTSVLAIKGLSNSSEDKIRLSKLIGPGIVLVIVAVLSSAAHAFTPKYQFEINAPGKVYLSYMVGAICVSTILAIVLLTLLRAPSEEKLFRLLIISALVVSFGLAQQVINWGLGSLSSSAYANNAALSAVTTVRGTSEVERCQVLQNWTTQGWPEYYLHGVIAFSTSAYELFHNEEFCSSFSK